MINILANDGMDPSGKALLEQHEFKVDTQHVPQEELASALVNYEVLTVRSATKVRKVLMDSCPNLKLIARGGVGMDNIDVSYAKAKGIAVFNTPEASSISVAELVFSHLFSGVRFLFDANRLMPGIPESGHGNHVHNVNFESLKKKYAKGSELRDKTLGIIGFGRIGKEVARMAWALGMNVTVYDVFAPSKTVELERNGHKFSIAVKPVTTLQELLVESDFITIHVPGNEGGALIGAGELALMKKGAGIINTSRGGIVDEHALLDSLNLGHIAFAGLDVFENEPSPMPALLSHPKISLSPHIGASTLEAQDRIGKELANLIIAYFNHHT